MSSPQVLKASQVIDKLHRLVIVHGNLNVYVPSSNDLDDWQNFEVLAVVQDDLYDADWIPPDGDEDAEPPMFSAFVIGVM